MKTLTLDLDEAVLRETPPRARWRTSIRQEMVTRRLVDIDSGEQLDRCSLWDNERAWEASANVEVAIEEYWMARGYQIQAED